MTIRIKSGRTVSADLTQEGQSQVAVQVALVKLVEDDGTDVFQKGIGQQLPGQNAFGQESQRRLPRQPSFEANLETDFLAECPPLFLGDSRGAGPGRDAPRLEHDDRRIFGGKQARVAGLPAGLAWFFPIPAARPAPAIAPSRRSMISARLESIGSGSIGCFVAGGWCYCRARAAADL